MAEITGWRQHPFDRPACAASIDDARVGTGSASNLPDGPAGALAWLLGHCAARGRPLKAGDVVTTGAVTGVHRIVAGQTACFDIGAFGQVLCRAKPASPFIQTPRS